MQLQMSRAVVRAAARLALIGVACLGCSAGSSPSGAAEGLPGNDVDATSTDAARLDDTGSRDGEGGALDWCSSGGTSHLLCEDFDQGVPGRLTSKTYGGGTVAADVSDYVSATESMWASTPPLVGPHGAGGAIAMASFDADGPHFQLQAEVQVAPDCAANGDGATLASVTFDTYSVTLLAALGGSYLVEQTYAPDGGLAGSTQHRLATPIPNNDWSPIVLELDFSTREASVTVSGEATLSHQPLSLVPSPIPTAPTIALGVQIENRVGQSEGCRVRVDNILFDSF
jgi:hypothetical protein